MENKHELKPKIVLGIAAHPDDLDFAASGSFATWSSQGVDVYYLLLTDGSKGSADPDMTSEKLIEIREAEQKKAAEIVGAKGAFFLRHPDGMLEVTMDLKKEICSYIRKLKPDVIVTMDPSVLYSDKYNYINHPDHRAAGQATLDSVFPLSRDRLSFPELFEQGLLPHKVKTLLLTNFDKQNFYVDITENFDKKVSALAAHASQIDDVEGVKGFMAQWATAAGGRIGVKYAEGFLRLDISD